MVVVRRCAGWGARFTVLPEASVCGKTAASACFTLRPSTDFGMVGVANRLHAKHLGLIRRIPQNSASCSDSGTHSCKCNGICARSTITRLPGAGGAGAAVFSPQCNGDWRFLAAACWPPGLGASPFQQQQQFRNYRVDSRARARIPVSPELDARPFVSAPEPGGGSQLFRAPLTTLRPPESAVVSEQAGAASWPARESN